MQDLRTTALIAVTALLTLVPVIGEGAGNGVCNGRPLPSGQSRRWRNHHLECPSNSDTFVRNPLPFDIDRWRELENDWTSTGNAEYRRQMQAVGQEQPLIRWSGRIPYSTVEHWDWTAWVYGKDPSCGYDVHKHCYRDSKGKEHCTTTRTMRSCWHNEPRHESRHCSDEIMPFDAGYVRPTLQEWSPGVENYYDVLPNKYDLMPGETESVQISTNSGGGWFGEAGAMTPGVSIGDAWNEYAVNVQFRHGADRVACVYGGGSYHLDVSIRTDKRLLKTTPNAFRNPVDEFGREVDAIEWVLDAKGTRSAPYALKLADASAVMIAALSRVTQNADIEKAKRQSDEAAEQVRNFRDNASTGFWKDTRVRLRLYHLNWISRNVRVVENFYTRGANVARGAQSENYEIDLGQIYQASGPFFPEFWKAKGFQFEPGQEYGLYVSMYQKGVPFYAQDCDDPKTSKWFNCRTGLRGESNWYSKELPIKFRVERKAIDQRHWLQRLSDFQGKSWASQVRTVWFWVTGY